MVTPVRMITLKWHQGGQCEHVNIHNITNMVPTRPQVRKTYFLVYNQYKYEINMIFIPEFELLGALMSKCAPLVTYTHK